MIAIYVQRSWLMTVGNIADLIIVQEEAGDYVSLLAGPATVNPPFVEAELARSKVAKKGEVFLPAKIPIAVISGIFDLTEGEVSKYGFHPPEKK
jgi:hypothetical protein